MPPASCSDGGCCRHHNIQCQCTALTDGHATALHFEAMAAGAVVLTEAALVPHMASLGFVEGVHYLACNETQGVDALALMLRNKDPTMDSRLRRIAARGQRLVRRKYRSEFTSRAMHAAIMGILPHPLQPEATLEVKADTARASALASAASADGGAHGAVVPTPAMQLESPGPYVGRLGWRTALEQHQGPGSDVIDGVQAILAARTIIIRSAGSSVSLRVACLGPQETTGMCTAQPCCYLRARA